MSYLNHEVNNGINVVFPVNIIAKMLAMGVGLETSLVVLGPQEAVAGLCNSSRSGVFVERCQDSTRRNGRYAIFVVFGSLKLDSTVVGFGKLGEVSLQMRPQGGRFSESTDEEDFLCVASAER